jgi:cyd operon protein YbgT
MWYFSWILGVLLACALGIINVLRLEAQEAMDREHADIDPLTHLLAKTSMMARLREKVDNSHRNRLPFALIYLSLTDFRERLQLQPHEMDTTLLKVVEVIRQEIRLDLDIAGRIDENELLLALPGACCHKGTVIAERIYQHVLETVKTPGGEAVKIQFGVAEYPGQDAGSEPAWMLTQEVNDLLSRATEAAQA